MKPAEFTDHASAQAFLAAGRKKGERATADGWNTVLYDRGSHLALELHGTPVVTYTATETTISIPMRNHVVADRIQRYGFADRFRLETSGRTWALSQAWGTLPGIDEQQTIWYPVVAEVPADVVITSAGLVSPTPNPMPPVLTSADRAMIFAGPVKQWLSKVMKMLDAGMPVTTDDWMKCQHCILNPKAPWQLWSSLAMQAGDHKHLMSHVLEGAVFPCTLASLMSFVSSAGPLGIMVDAGTGIGTMGGSNRGYERARTRRYLKAALNTITR